MNNPRLGVLGTGDFGAYFISALRNGGHEGEILLSPHSKAKAEKLANEHGCTVASSDGELLSKADWLLLAVRPEHLSAALPKLIVRPDQVLLSAVAGLSVAELRSATRTSAPIIRLMPSSYIGVIRDGLLPIHPGDASVEVVLAKAGKVLVLEAEDQFELSMIGACLSGWMYRFIGTLETWFIERGLTEEQARQIVAGNVLGTAGNALARPDTPLQKLSDEIATEGTYTKLGLDHLLREGSFGPWTAALAVVHEKLQSTS